MTDNLLSPCLPSRLLDTSVGTRHWHSLLLPGWTLAQPRPFTHFSLRSPVTRDSWCYPPAGTFGHQCQPELGQDFKCPFSHCSGSIWIPALVTTASVPWPRPAPSQPTSPLHQLRTCHPSWSSSVESMRVVAILQMTLKVSQL